MCVLKLVVCVHFVQGAGLILSLEASVSKELRGSFRGWDLWIMWSHVMSCDVMWCWDWLCVMMCVSPLSRIFKLSIVCTTLLYIVFGVCGYLVRSLSSLSQSLLSFLQCGFSFSPLMVLVTLSLTPPSLSLSPSLPFLSHSPPSPSLYLLSHTSSLLFLFLPFSLHSLSAQTQIVSSPSTYQVVSMFPGLPLILVPQCITLHPYLCGDVVMHMYVCTRVCNSMQQYAIVCNSVQQCATVCNSVQQCARIDLITSSPQDCSRSWWRVVFVSLCSSLIPVSSTGLVSDSLFHCSSYCK